MWTWRQLGYHAKPIGLLNAGGYWDGLLAFLRQTRAAGFVGDAQLGLVDVDGDALALLPRLVQAAGLAPRGRPAHGLKGGRLRSRRRPLRRCGCG